MYHKIIYILYGICNNVFCFKEIFIHISIKVQLYAGGLPAIFPIMDDIVHDWTDFQEKCLLF